MTTQVGAGGGGTVAPISVAGLVVNTMESADGSGKGELALSAVLRAERKRNGVCLSKPVFGSIRRVTLRGRERVTSGLGGRASGPVGGHRQSGPRERQ